ncbi:MAG: hypothetical protein V1872_12765 [bacterium]
MSKKKHKKQDKDKTKDLTTTLLKLSDKELQENAGLFLERGQYKKAIENYKIIISKRGPSAKILNKLFIAYQGRIKEFAEKGMQKEAIELWEYIDKTYSQQLDVSLYIDQLLLIKDYHKAVKIFFQDRGKIKAPEEIQRIESALALLVLARKEEIISFIPQNSLIIRQRSLIEEGLQAIYEGMEEKVGEFIQPIGLHSPYKDWKVFLRGLVAFYRHQDQEAYQIFNRLPKDSPLTNVASFLNFVLNLASERQDIIGYYSAFKSNEVSFLREIIGSSVELLTIIKILSSQANQLGNNREVTNTLKKLAVYLPAEEDQRYLRDTSSVVLVTSSTKTFARNYESLWGKALDPFEENRLLAVISEKNKNLKEANKYWEICLNYLKGKKTRDIFTNLKELNIAIALILRRLADNTKKLGMSEEDFWAMNFFDFMSGRNRGEEKKYVTYLTESLKYDPADEQTYQKLINFYRKTGEEKEAIKWLEGLLKVFPDHVATLLEVATIAFRRKAIQKSLSFLDKALKYDPLNVKARHLKVSIHIYSAFQRFQQKKFKLVEKDFEDAQALLISKTDTNKFQITRGLAEIAMGEKEKGYAFIDEAVQIANNSFDAYFQVLIESSIWGIAEELVTPYLKVFEERLNGDPQVLEIKRLMNLALSYFQSEGLPIQFNTRKKMRYIKPYLERAVNLLQFSEGEILEICNYLAIVRLYPLLVHYAREGRKKYGENCRLRFYAFVGRSKGLPLSYVPELGDLYGEVMDECEEVRDEKTFNELAKFEDGCHPLYSRKPSDKDGVDEVSPRIRLSNNNQDTDKQLSFF